MISHCEDVFTIEELQKIIDYCEAQPLDTATTLGADNIRRSNIRFINYDPNNEEISWIFKRLDKAIKSLNNQFYGFNLDGYGYFQYTTYTSEQQGHYGWHIDAEWLAEETRKLSISLLLNDDFTGGEFQLNLSREDEAQTVPIPKGRLIAFPSFMIHRVKPVLTGVRKSMVVWAVGPKWT